MKHLRRIFRFMLILALGVILYISFVEAPYCPTAFVSPMDRASLPRIIAHKATGGPFHGDTVEEIEALKDSAIEGLEIDVQLTKDGVPVIFHGDLLEEGTDGHGAIADHTLSDLGNVHYATLQRETIPTLAHVFEKVERKKRLFLDVKAFGFSNKRFAAAISSAIEIARMQTHTVVESFNPFFLYELRKINPHIPIMLDSASDVRAVGEETQGQFDKIPWILQQPFCQRILRRVLAPDVLGPRFTEAPEMLRELMAKGYPIVTWTVDDPIHATELLEQGIAGLQTNKPLELLAALSPQLGLRIDDESRLNLTEVKRIIEVHSEADVRRAFLLAEELGTKLSVAGRRHSMGGQTFQSGAVVLDMLSYNDIHYDADTETVTAQAGAVWSDVQRILNTVGRSVAVMQSDTLFSVGGSLSVNAHGWQSRSAPISSTVESLRVMLPSGDAILCSRDANREIFESTLGGYGLMGVILEARLRTVPNKVYERRSYFFPAEEYPKKFAAEVIDNASTEMSFGRLNIDPKNFLKEAGLHVFRTVPHERVPEEMEPEGFVDARRAIFRLSEGSNRGKAIRWLAEKIHARITNGMRNTRNEVMSPDIHDLWPTNFSTHDILQEYFVPYEQFGAMLSNLRELVPKYELDLLNVTIRDIREDKDTLLNYARGDMFAFVLFFAHDGETSTEERFKTFTETLGERVVSRGGTFYLPYRLTYSRQLFQKAYPRWEQFLSLKRRFDPAEILSSAFYNYASGK